VSIRITRSIRIDTIAVGRPRPRQQDPGLQLAQSAATHALDDEAALVLGHRAPDLQQKLIVRILAHWPVEELDLATSGGDLLQQEHLMHVVACQPIRCRDQKPIELVQGRAVSQSL
jgi:hypothetical protein